MSFSLEVDNFGAWEHVQSFPRVAVAKEEGFNNYPHNNWRVTNARGRVVYENRALEGLEHTAQEDLERFRNRDMWRERFALLSEVAARQRAEQQEAAEARRIARLQGFGFIGRSPEILQTMRQRVFFDDYYEDEESNNADKANWKSEGF